MRGTYGRAWRARGALAAFVLLAAMPGLTGYGAAAAVPALAGTTVFTAARNATTLVRLARTTHVDVDLVSSAQVDLRGDGRVAGFLFTALDRDVRDVRTFMALSVGACTTPRCRPSRPHERYPYVVGSDDLPTRDLGGARRRFTLPAGVYAVRSVTDGGPVRMTLRLPGLRGSARVDVARPHRVVLETYSSSGGVAGVDPLRTGWGAHRVSHEIGLLFHVVLYEYAPHLRTLTGTCYYRDKTPPLGRPLPGCPDSEFEFVDNIGAPGLHHHGIAFGSVFTLLEGTWGQAFWATGVGGSSSFHAIALWTDLGQ